MKRFLIFIAALPMGKVTKLDSEFKPFLSKDLVHVRKPLIKPEMVDGFRSNSL